MAAPPPPPMALPARPFDDPTLYKALRDVNLLVVDENNGLNEEKVYLLQKTSNPQRAYRKLPKAPVPIEGRGEVVFCQVLLRDRSSPHHVVFRESDTIVAIKKLKRWIIDPLIERARQEGGDVVNENPYNEIYIMQKYGNFENVMQCYEALKDELFLYIIMLYVRDGDLESRLSRHQLGNMGYQPSSEIPDIMRKLVHNLQYMKQHHLIHRDLKPPNIMVKPPWLPIIDFAMTLQCGNVEETVHHILPQGPAGTYGYISPEVFHNLSFNYKADVWALGCILWDLLTGLRLYWEPRLLDRAFRFFIALGALNDEARCEEKLEEVLQENAQNVEARAFQAKLQAVLVLPDVTRDLLHTLLQPKAANRPTLEEILEHPFFHQ